MSTAFRAREPTFNFDKSTSILIALIFQLPDNFTTASITNRESEFSTFDHILHGQILNCNHLVFTNQSSCQFVKKVNTSITNLVDGSAPYGSSRLHRISRGRVLFAKNTLPSFHLKADLINSALPP